MSGATDAPARSAARAPLGASPIEVLGVEVRRATLGAEARAALRALYGIDDLPFAEATVQVELRGVSTAAVNAIRRAAMDEMPGRALAVPPDGFDPVLTTDEFALPQFVNQRLALMPLCPHIPPETVASLRLRLDITNGDATVKSVHSGDLVVAAGALGGPVFNPTFELVALQPGRRIVINGIHISTGRGRDNAAFNVARRGAYRHLDLEQYTSDEMRKHPDSGGVASDLSGYKVSCLVAKPRHHMLTLVIPAASPELSEAKSVVSDACSNLEDRLRLVISAVEQRSGSGAPEGNSAHKGIQYTVVRLGGGLEEAHLLIPGETTSIGEMVRSSLCDLTPGISYAASVVIVDSGRLSLTVRHTDDVTRALLAALRHAVETFAEVRRQVGLRAIQH